MLVEANELTTPTLLAFYTAQLRISKSSFPILGTNQGRNPNFTKGEAPTPIDVILAHPFILRAP